VAFKAVLVAALLRTHLAVPAEALKAFRFHLIGDLLGRAHFGAWHRGGGWPEGLEVVGGRGRLFGLKIDCRLRLGVVPGGNLRALASRLAEIFVVRNKQWQMVDSSGRSDGKKERASEMKRCFRSRDAGKFSRMRSAQKKFFEHQVCEALTASIRITSS
jgi:hypothetical protein